MAKTNGNYKLYTYTVYSADGIPVMTREFDMNTAYIGLIDEIRSNLGIGGYAKIYENGKFDLKVTQYGIYN